jgi:hypothetical protein
MTNEEIAEMKVDQLREFILTTEELGYTESDVAKMKKGELVKVVQNYTQQLSDTATEFDLKYEKEENGPNTLQEVLPQYGTDEWQKYVLSLLRPDEMFEGSPKMAGLRRVAQLLLGDIVHSGAESVSVIAQEDGRAVTVNYKVVFAWKLDFGVNITDIANTKFELRTFMGVADCVENRDSIYAVHPAAFAETKAMARAFKTALCLSIVTADEKISGYGNVSSRPQQTKKDETDRPASPHLIKTVVSWAQASKVDHLDVLRKNMKEITGGEPKDFDDLTEGEIRKLFSIMSTTKHG